MGDAHVVGNDVDDQAHGALLQVFRKRGKFFLRPDFGIEASVVGHVIAVQAAGMSHEERGGIAIGDTEIMQIIHHRGGLAESKSQIELKAVGRAGNIDRFSRSSVLRCHRRWFCSDA